ncbi:DUF2256 domain-containing protein [Cellvibrio sp. KY-GH-1]|uniref:DUF2256 domain-containing protein n=1 Tax=Cellvibrio sp. KY-GH-1 TaxID=2303332 RepID=UPI00351A89C5
MRIYGLSQSRSSEMKKENLPQKICIYCQRPFSWRKKWERDWAQVRYCSKACGSAARTRGVSR